MAKTYNPKLILWAAFLIALNFKFSNGLVSNATWFYNSDRPLVFGRKGSCGQFPEYSTGGYIDAYLNGADFIELTV